MTHSVRALLIVTINTFQNPSRADSTPLFLVPGLRIVSLVSFPSVETNARHVFGSSFIDCSGDVCVCVGGRSSSQSSGYWAKITPFIRRRRHHHHSDGLEALAKIEFPTFDWSGWSSQLIRSGSDMVEFWLKDETIRICLGDISLDFKGGLYSIINFGEANIPKRSRHLPGLCHWFRIKYFKRSETSMKDDYSSDKSIQMAKVIPATPATAKQSH